MSSTLSIPSTQSIEDRPSRELALSSFDPTSVLRSPTSEPEDYDALIAELNRLEEKCQALKMRITLLDFAPPIEA